MMGFVDKKVSLTMINLIGTLHKPKYKFVLDDRLPFFDMSIVTMLILVLKFCSNCIRLQRSTRVTYKRLIPTNTKRHIPKY